MFRLLPILSFVLLFLASAGRVCGQSNELAELQAVTVVVEDLDTKEKMLGLNEAWVKDHALGLLRSKLPQLSVDRPSAEGSLLIDATFGMIEQEGKVVRYYGVLELDVFRLVAIKKTDQIVWAPVWGGQYILTGLTPQATFQVKETLGLLITDFAAKWRRDNSPLEGQSKK